MDDTTTYEKVDKNTLKITEQPPIPEPIVTTYSIDELTKNRDNLIAELSSITLLLDDVNVLIDKAHSLGIVAQVEATLPKSDILK